MLIALYEIRNNRGVGHAGGDINPNHMDATCVLYMSKWIVAELIRVFNGLDTKEANATVNTIVERILPIVWEVDGKKRVLNTQLKAWQKVLLILYSSLNSVDEDELRISVEYKNASNFRSLVLMPLHDDKMVEYNPSAKRVTLSPLGSKLVEEDLINYDM
jgi:hypothetical protein